MAQHNLGRVAILAGLILPFPGFQLALDINLTALAQVFLGHIAQAIIENRDRMPFGAFLLIAVPVLIALRRGDAQVHHLAAILEIAHFRVPPQTAQDNDLIDTRHGKALPRFRRSG